MREAESEQLVPVAPVQLVVVSATTRQLPLCSPLPPDGKYGTVLSSLIKQCHIPEHLQYISLLFNQFILLLLLNN